MLKKVVVKDCHDWDCLLPHLLLAIWEVHQSSMKLCPLELIYERPPCGLMDVVKEAREQVAMPYPEWNTLHKCRTKWPSPLSI